MTFPILGGNSAVAGGYAIDNSLRVNSGDSPSMTRTPSSAGNRKTFTLSTWFKLSKLSGERVLFNADDGTGSNDNSDYVAINGQHQILLYSYVGAEIYHIKSNQVLRDTSAWYHIVIAFDTTQATASNRVKIYLNGNQITSFVTSNYPSQNTDTKYNNNNPQGLFKYPDQSTNYYDGYVAETIMIDGQQLDANSFGEYDADSGIWKPIQYTGSYGTNGFYLDFENSGSLGADQSGNGNNFTPTNLGSTDQMLDTPTNNWCTLNAVSEFNNSTFSEGNLKYTGASASVHPAIGTIGITSGKWYFEAIRLSGASAYPFVGVYKVDGTAGMGGYLGDTIDGWCMLLDGTDNGEWRNDTTLSGTSAGTFVNGDIANIAIDMDNGKIWFGRNGTWANSGNPSAGTGEQYSNLSGTIVPAISVYTGASVGLNFGQEGSFAGNKTAQGNSDANGQGDFYYSVPTGFNALCTQNLATALSPMIDDGSQYFNTVLWTGNATDDRSITGVGFAPDFVWTKERSSTSSHVVHDTTRGATYTLIPNQNASESVQADILKAFESDGFQIGTSGAINENSQTYVGWNWKANGGTTSSNTDGTKTTTVQTSQTSGFSIVTYNGLTNGQTIGHGLGATPEMIIFKRRDAVGSWHTWHQGLGDGYNYIYLNSTSAKQNDAYEYISNIGSSTVQLQGSSTFTNDTIGYFFRGVEGYSKFGKYTGNGSTDGTFVYTGFRPAFVLIKRTTGTEDWIIYDSVRDTFNAVDSFLKPNISDAEGTASYGDLLSNGFKARNTFAPLNASGEPHIYMAFAENPFVTSGGVPVTAR
jgi:hypothetical protein